MAKIPPHNSRRRDKIWRSAKMRRCIRDSHSTTSRFSQTGAVAPAKRIAMLLENARQKQRWHSHPREALLLCSLALLPRCSAWWAGAGSAVLRTTVIKTGSGGHNSRRSSCKARFGVGGYGRLQHSRGSGRPRIGELRCSAASRPPGEVLDSASGIVGPAYDEVWIILHHVLVLK